MTGPTARFALLLALLAPGSLAAQIARDSARLAEVIVTARRDSTAPRLAAGAADLLSNHELRRRGVHRLADALRLLPGSTVVTNGAPGGVTSTFFRGVNSNQTLLMVDGVRLNDGNTSPAVLLGGLELDGDELEVVRGPQSTLYGGAAIGGVIAVGASNEVGRSIRIKSEAGSFGTFRAALTGSAGTDRLEIRGSATVVDTDNERRFNGYGQRAQALHVRGRPSQRVQVGVSLRALQSSYTSPGDIRSSNSTPVGDTDFDHTLVTGFVDGRLSPRWTSRLTVGHQHYFTRGSSQFDGGPVNVSRVTARRWVTDWQHRIGLGAITAVGGVNAEWATVGDGESSRDERLKAGYLDLTARLSDNAMVTAGLRRDDYTTFGGRTTGRLTASYFAAGHGLKLRSSVGSGFLPPYLAARFGGPFQRANPDIRAERSVGWDAGIDRFFARNRGVASITVFGNALSDLLGFESAPFPELGRAINIGRARTRGLELSSRLAVGRLDGRISYTYLTAEDRDAATVAERRLIRRPRHTASVDVLWAESTIDLGAGASVQLDREDADFNSFPFRRVDPGNIVELRVHGGWRVASRWAIHGRAENLLNRRSEDVYGFPTLGRRVALGLTFGQR